MNYHIAASILSADVAALGDEVLNVTQSGADWIHFDVMDNHFVPNLTLGPFVCQALTTRMPSLAIDVHLMATPVDALIHQFAQAKAKRISIHPEACLHLNKNLSLILELGCQAGLALNPATSPACLEWCYHQLDFVLVMMVNPGFSGQKLLDFVIGKIRFIKKYYPTLTICVDGGVTIDNIRLLADAGASTFILGSALFSTTDYQQTIANLRRQLQATS